MVDVNGRLWRPDSGLAIAPATAGTVISDDVQPQAIYPALPAEPGAEPSVHPKPVLTRHREEFAKSWPQYGAIGATPTVGDLVGELLIDGGEGVNALIVTNLSGSVLWIEGTPYTIAPGIINQVIRTIPALRSARIVVLVAAAPAGNFYMLATTERLQPTAGAQPAIPVGGSVTIVGPLGEQLSAASLSVVLSTDARGAAHAAAGQVLGAVGPLSTQVLAARPTRSAARITNLDAAITVWLGISAGVTASTGDRLPPGASTVVTYKGTVDFIANSGTPTLSYWDEYE